MCFVNLTLSLSYVPHSHRITQLFFCETFRLTNPFRLLSFIESLREEFNKRVDVVDETNLANEPEGLLENIRREGVLLYEQKS
mgnify:CR=1 FL=1